MKRFFKPLAYIIVIIVLFFMIKTPIGSVPKEISYTEFLEKAEFGDIERIEIIGDTIRAYPYESKDYFITKYIEDQEFVKYMTEQEITVESKNDSSRFVSTMFSLIISFAPLAIMIFWFSRMMNGGGDNQNGMGMLFSAGKNKGKMYCENDTGVKFSDVAGQEEAKESITEIIDYLKNSEKYQQIGAKMPKGALLVGPPGTGKTLLAKAVAGEAGVPFFSITGSSFVEMFVGVGASRVRDLFEEAKNNAPCIIFIDEIDAIGKSRGSNARAGGNDEREQTLNQLLAEMDGFDASTAIVVLAATNRPEILDKALTRPGRFDRRVVVDRPDLKGREEILQVHIKNVNVDETVNLKTIAQATAGAVGADLANIINEAALRAVKFNRNSVSQEDLTESVELVFAGKEKKDRVMTEKERRLVAYHEIGHAVIAALQKNSAPVQKITIVPRTNGALGYTMQVPEEEHYLSSRDEMFEEIRTLIGGRCAEEVFFNTVTTGASNDIEKVTDLVKKMLTIYGMSDMFDMVTFESTQSYYLDGPSVMNCSDVFSSAIDREMVRLVKLCHAEVRNMIMDNQELIHEAASVLLQKENITGDEFMDIFRKYHDESYSWEMTVDMDSDTTAIPVEAPQRSIEPPKSEKAIIPPPKPKTSVKEPSKASEDKGKKEDTMDKKADNKKQPNETEKKKDNSSKEIKEVTPSESQNIPEVSELSELPEDFPEPPEPGFDMFDGEPFGIDSDIPKLADMDTDEPPAPDFSFDDIKKPSEEKADEQKSAPKKKPAFEAPKGVSFAPKPLQKKKKDDKQPKQQQKSSQSDKKEDDKPTVKPTPKQDAKEEDKAVNMSSLIQDFKNNSNGKSKYVQSGSGKKKENPPGVLTPDMDASSLKKKQREEDKGLSEDDY